MSASELAEPVDSTPDRNGARGKRAAGRSVRHRTLLVTEYFPGREEAVSGAFQRLRSHCSALRGLGRVDIAFLWPERGQPSSREAIELEDRARRALPVDGRIFFVPVRPRDKRVSTLSDLIWACKGAVGFFNGRPTLRTSGREQAAALTRILRATQADLVFAHRLGAAAPLLRVRSTLPPIVLDVDDLEHVRLARWAKVTERRPDRLRILAWSWIARWTERRLVGWSSRALVCSETDRQKLRAISHSANVVVIPNVARALGPFPPSATATAVFVGVATYGPNREAILWLAREIWPLVRKAFPSANLQIAGEGSEHLGLMPNELGIEVLGFTPNLDSVYRAARIALCPVQRGGGTRIKIIEAAHAGRTIVTTTIGAEGLTFEAGSEIAIADDASEFAESCIALLRDPIRAAVMGEGARRRARTSYAPDRVEAGLVVACLEALATVGANTRRAKWTASAIDHALLSPTVEGAKYRRKPDEPPRHLTGMREVDAPPLVSIIIAIYNVGPRLVRCLETVVAQTLKNIEIIVVDDSSTDGSAETALAFAARDTRIRVVRNEKNVGQSAALNNGFRIASGRTVRFIDGDDVLPLNSSEVLYDTYKRHGPDIVRGDAMLLDDGALWQAAWMPPSIETHGASFATCEQLWPHLGGVWRHLFDRQFLVANNILHEEGVRVGQDHLLNTKAYISAKSISIIPDCVYHYDFWSENSLTRPSSPRNHAYLDEATSLADNLRQLRPYPMPYLINLTFQAGYRLNLLERAVEHLDKDSAKQVLSTFAEMYATIDLGAAAGILQALHYDVPEHSEKTMAIAERLHRGEIDPLYDWMRSRAGGG